MWSIIHFFVLLSAEPVVIINETIRMKRGCSWVMQWPEMNADLLISFRTKGSNMNYGRNFTFPTLAHLPICAQPHIIHIQAWHTSSTKLNDVLKEYGYFPLETHFINKYGLKSANDLIPNFFTIAFLKYIIVLCQIRGQYLNFLDSIYLFSLIC